MGMRGRMRPLRVRLLERCMKYEGTDKINRYSGLKSISGALRCGKEGKI